MSRGEEYDRSGRLLESLEAVEELADHDVAGLPVYQGQDAVPIESTDNGIALDTLRRGSRGDIDDVDNPVDSRAPQTTAW